MVGNDGNKLALRIAGLNKSFGDVQAVDGLDLEVARGECFGLLGPNGAGKTTTIEICEGLTEPDSGVVELLGMDWKTAATALRQRIGIQLQETQFPDKLTVEETIRLFRSFYRHGLGVEELIATMQLEEKRRSRVGGLSGGQKQRLAMATALAGDPELVFLDEPTTGLDPQARRHLWELVEELKRAGRTVILTTHYMEESEYCDRLGVIYRGELIALGTPRALKTEHMQEAVLEIECERPNLAMELVERLPEIKEAALFGKGLHAVTRDPNAAPAIQAVQSALASAGFRTTKVESIIPTLEDVFVSLIEARDRAGAPQAEVRR